jgi:hypothetical protein
MLELLCCGFLDRLDGGVIAFADLSLEMSNLAKSFETMIQ